jgi:hypothetical protein
MASLIEHSPVLAPVLILQVVAWKVAAIAASLVTFHPHFTSPGLIELLENPIETFSLQAPYFS